MPSKEHRVLVEMFTHCPDMAVWLLERSGLRFPEYERIEAVDGRFTLVTAVGEKEMAADLVLICRDGRGDAVQTIIVEIQRGRDPGKVMDDEEFTFEAEIFTRRIKAAEERAAQAAAQTAARAAETSTEAKAVLSVLGARGFVITEAQREEILACDDSARLEGALVRAATGDPGQPFTF